MTRVWDALLGSQPLTRWLTALEKWLWSLNEVPYREEHCCGLSVAGLFVYEHRHWISTAPDGTGHYKLVRSVDCERRR